MSQRSSGHARIPLDLYQTRERWVAEALAERFSLVGARIWECAAGDGLLAQSLEALGANVIGTDIAGPFTRFDFTSDDPAPARVRHVDAIVTNPPYGERGALALRFIERGLTRIRPGHRKMAMLLPVDFDSAKTRAHVFADCFEFTGKIVLTKRIRWFDPEPGKKNMSPSVNHAWFLWSASRDRTASPKLFYGPREPMKVAA